MSRRLIKDEFTDLPVSRQRKYQLRRVAKGGCMICAAPIALGRKGYCERHAIAHANYMRELMRQRLGCVRRYESKYQPTRRTA